MAKLRLKKKVKKNLSRLLSTNRRMSPLTGLPGNVQINSELKKHLMKELVLEA